MTTMEEQLYGFYQFSGSKNHWEEKHFLNFLFQEMSLKREIFVNFLPQKFMKKYGIVSAYSVTFVSQKILTCLQCLLILAISCHFAVCLSPAYLLLWLASAVLTASWCLLIAPQSLEQSPALSLNGLGHGMSVFIVK